MKLVPRTFKGALFVLLTVANVGLAAFFAARAESQEAILSSVTALLCLGVWLGQLDGSGRDDVS